MVVVTQGTLNTKTIVIGSDYLQNSSQSIVTGKLDQLSYISTLYYSYIAQT